ncbi:T6SS immunity protein Tli3 family protein [Collimonas humicola]|uniref:T6SS immunity protein Tli3 family protein n=1 Tax=Collimonas humicola TaxID=2825886 RepID=UPI001B8AAFB9|nr:hypothetical protein [Collimonas humicola]
MTHSSKTLTCAAMLLAGVLLSACALHRTSGSEPPYSGPVAQPQVAYRIDEQRFFEIVPLRAEACSSADLYYTDTAHNIRSRVSYFMAGYNLRTDFIIDAANDQYLVAPIVRGNIDCESGGNGCSGSRLPYSTDGGRTWKAVETRFNNGPIRLINSNFYIETNDEAETLDISKDGQGWKDWRRGMIRNMGISNPQRRPIDSKFHCTPNGRE